MEWINEFKTNRGLCHQNENSTLGSIRMAMHGQKLHARGKMEEKLVKNEWWSPIILSLVRQSQQIRSWQDPFWLARISESWFVSTLPHISHAVAHLRWCVVNYAAQENELMNTYIFSRNVQSKLPHEVRFPPVSSRTPSSVSSIVW